MCEQCRNDAQMRAARLGGLAFFEVSERAELFVTLFQAGFRIHRADFIHVAGQHFRDFIRGRLRVAMSPPRAVP